MGRRARLCACRRVCLTHVAKSKQTRLGPRHIPCKGNRTSPIRLPLCPQVVMHRIRYPAAKDPLDAASFGAAAAPAGDSLALLPFQGQMGSIFLFDDVLSPGGLLLH